MVGITAITVISAYPPVNTGQGKIPGFTTISICQRLVSAQNGDTKFSRLFRINNLVVLVS